jgi:hypothetical protein
MKRNVRFNAGIRRVGLKFPVTAILLCVSVFTLCQAQTISPGTTMAIRPGTVVSSDNPLSVTSGGILDVQGTLILKKNLDNQSSTSSDLGTGVIELSGTTQQTVSGQNTIGKLRINNAAGVVIAGNTRVNDSLKIINGLVTLGSYNLLLGPSALCSTGSSSAMVVAEGTGALRKEFSTTPSFPMSFTYPVGDNTGTAEYSPVTVNFTSGTFGTGNSLGVNLKNLPDPDPNVASGNYLSRYWTLDNNAISGTISCGLTLNFLDADVTGTKANLFCVKSSPVLETYNGVSGNQLTGTVSSFSRFTGADAALQASLNVFLQGPYSATGDTMANTLATGLPLGDRSVLTNFPSNQPYNGTPWNYTGTESVTSLPANVVDWVLVELRQASTAAGATNATVFARRAGFLKKDGTIVDPDGTPLKFYHATVTSNVFPVVRHRNHIAIMAANAVVKNGTGSYAYDYSSGSTQVWGGTAGVKQIDTSPVRWGMIAGDANGDNSVFNNDYTGYYIPTFFNSGQYRPADFNMDSNVFNNDYTGFYIPNFFIDNQLP